MLEVTSGVLDVDRRKRFAQYVYQSILGAGSCSAQNALDLGEGLPTFICVVQAHILDDAQGGRGWLANACRWRDGSRGIAPRSRWRPRPLIEIGEKSLRREPSVGRSEGRVVTEVWRWQWIEPG